MGIITPHTIRILACMSLASLQILPVWNEFASVSERNSYFLPDYLPGSYWSPLLTWFILSAAIYFLYRLFHCEALSGMKPWLPAFVLLTLVNPLTLNGYYLYERTSTIKLMPLISGNETLFFMAIAGTIAIILSLARKFHIILGRTLLVGLVCLSPFGFLYSVQAFVNQAPPTISNTASDLTSTSSSKARRVIILLFDEFDQSVAFETRPKDLQLPELDKLIKTSLSANHVVQAGINTITAIPGMLSGQLISTAIPVGPTDLQLKPTSSEMTVSWKNTEHLFQRVKQAGYRSGVVGWYHNYCRLFSQDIDVCKQLYLGSIQVHPGKHNLIVDQLKSVNPMYRRINARTALTDGIDETMRMATNPNLDLVYIHLPVPHEPFLYDLENSEMSIWQFGGDGYYANLVLLDHLVGQVREGLAKANLADSTALIITSDHAWRGAEAYGGRPIENRIPFIYHPANANDFAAFEMPIGATFFRDFVLSALGRKLETVDDGYDKIVKLSNDHVPTSTKQAP